MGLTPPQDQPEQPGTHERGAGSDPGPAPVDAPGPPLPIGRLDEPDLVRMLELLRARSGRRGVACTHGLSPAEAARLRELGSLIELGPRILRVETAVIALLARLS